MRTFLSIIYHFRMKKLESEIWVLTYSSLFEKECVDDAAYQATQAVRYFQQAFFKSLNKEKE